jgi:hypothetical protein
VDPENETVEDDGDGGPTCGGKKAVKKGTFTSTTVAFE